MLRSQWGANRTVPRARRRAARRPSVRVQRWAKPIEHNARALTLRFIYFVRLRLMRLLVADLRLEFKRNEV